MSVCKLWGIIIYIGVYVNSRSVISSLVFTIRTFFIIFISQNIVNSTIFLHWNFRNEKDLLILWNAVAMRTPSSVTFRKSHLPLIVPGLLSEKALKRRADNIDLIFSEMFLFTIQAHILSSIRISGQVVFSVAPVCVWVHFFFWQHVESGKYFHFLDKSCSCFLDNSWKLPKSYHLPSPPKKTRYS